MSFEIYEQEDAMKQFVSKEINDMHTTFIAKIIEIFPNARQCSVELLQTVLANTVGETIQNIAPKIIKIPMFSIFENDGWIVSAPYDVEDKVDLQVSERPIIEPLQQDVVSEQQSFSRMQLNNSMVQKAIPTNIFKEAHPDPKNLILMNKKTGDFIKITSSGIEIQGDTEIKGNLSINGDVEIEGKLEVTKDIKCNGIVYAKKFSEI